MFHKDNIRSVYKLGFLKLRCLLGPMPRNSCIKSKFTSFPLMSSMNYWLLYFPASMMEIPISMKLFLMYLTNGIFFLLSLLIICIYLFYFVRQSFSQLGYYCGSHHNSTFCYELSEDRALIRMLVSLYPFSISLFLYTVGSLGMVVEMKNLCLRLCPRSYHTQLD